MKKFDIYMADLSPSVRCDNRPVMILQDIISEDMSTILCALITSRESNNDISVDIKTKAGKSMKILFDQIRNVDKNKFKEKIDDVSEDESAKIEKKLDEVLDLK